MASETQPHPHRNQTDGDDSGFLKHLGDRVREARSRRGMTRRILSKDSGVSERYLAELENGQGNISILLLRDVARALDLPLEVLVLEGPDPSLDLIHTVEFLRRLPGEDLLDARQMLLWRFGGVATSTRCGRIALIGLRGAGKSTLGAKLATTYKRPFFELDRLIEQKAGLPLSAIFDMYGQSAFRRLERQCLDELLENYPYFVVATGGSLVSETSTFERLLTMCFTIWVHADPVLHMERVIEQGDTRPMADNRDALADLKRILEVREPLYTRADLKLDTGRISVEKCDDAVRKAITKKLFPDAEIPD